MSVRRLLKRALAIAAFYSGFAWIRLIVGLRGRAVVLMYHRVLPARPHNDAFSADAIVVTPQTFERHMRFLRRFLNPVTLDEFRSMIVGETPWRPRACVVTFDDGWFDNVAHALPILERTGVPAGIFVATGYVGTSETFWQERLLRLLVTAWSRGERCRALFEELKIAQVLGMTAETARRELREFVSAMKSAPRGAVENVIQRIRSSLGLRPDDAGDIGEDRFMSWEQAAVLQDSRFVEVESHTHSHTPLTSLDPGAVREELDRSRAQLQTRLGKKARFLAYPNGDHDLQIAELARERGYELAFTTVPGWVAPGDDPMRLRRINVAEEGTTSVPGFLCRLLGWW
jgi:peptidoglycan/xylan/chitin deacetylase (PgdA/CDA1 family)